VCAVPKHATSQLFAPEVGSLCVSYAMHLLPRVRDAICTRATPVVIHLKVDQQRACCRPQHCSRLRCRCVPTCSAPHAQQADESTHGTQDADDSAASSLADGLAEGLQVSTPTRTRTEVAEGLPLATPSLQRRGRMQRMQPADTPLAALTQPVPAAPAAPAVRPARRRGRRGKDSTGVIDAESALDATSDGDASTAVATGLLMDPPRLGVHAESAGPRRKTASKIMQLPATPKGSRTCADSSSVSEVDRVTASRPKKWQPVIKTTGGDSAGDAAEAGQEHSKPQLPSAAGSIVAYHLVSACVNASRDSCKLRYLNGAAPVCYGVPTWFVCRREP
jgi:hypothetical protein